MFKIAGVILCVAGSAGYGMLKIATWNRAVTELEQWILLFEKMKSHIHYRRDLISEICFGMDDEIYGIGGKYMAAVGRTLREERSKNLGLAWREQMICWEKLSVIPVTVKKMIMAFPEYLGEQDCEQQIRQLDFYLQKLKREKEKLENEMCNKKKPVMAISLAGGITVSLLLL